jgi:hypothetical protein
MLDPALHLCDDISGVTLEPVPVKVLGDSAELDDEVAGKVLRLEFAAFLAPESNERRLVRAHDDPSVGAADKGSTLGKFAKLQCIRCHSCTPFVEISLVLGYRRPSSGDRRFVASSAIYGIIYTIWNE